MSPPPEVACPVCGKPGLARFKPFCSRRCADIDLGRWLKGSYRVPGAEPAPGQAPKDEDRDDDGQDPEST